jgi:hypothetical protein
MQNIKLSVGEYCEMLKNIGSYSAGRVVSVYGFPIHAISDGYIIYAKCEYCGQVRCRCGAPLEWQGKRLARGETLTDALIRLGKWRQQ